MTSHRSSIDRRDFLKLGAAASGVVVGGCARSDGAAEPSTTLELGRRPLGATGLEVSEVAFGAHGIDRPDLMRAAVDAGITTFCVSGNYLDGMEEVALGEAMSALGGRRDDMVIITGNPVREGASTRRVLDDIDASLERLGTDHIHVYLNGDVSSLSDLGAEGLFEAFERAREAGKVGHLGFSSHVGGMQEMMNAAIDDGRFEVFFIKYDFVSYPEQEKILRRAAKRGIGIMVFKTNAGARQHEIADLEAGGLSFQQASVKWALSNPDVASVSVTMSNFDTVRQYAAAAATNLSATEVAMLRRYAGEMHDRYCRFSAEREIRCPHGVAVADINRFEMYFSGYGREKEAMRRYHELPGQRSAAACLSCDGPCDGACPFGRAVRGGLVEAHRKLSFREA
jgi:aryl-alcohol dehydrogenase-like predicted oxidoreductase